MGNIVDQTVREPKLDGFNDADLHANIHEAVKVLAGAKEAYASALNSIEVQYLRALEASHDGDSVECQAIAAQVDAVRATF